MSWEKIVGYSFAALLSIIGVTLGGHNLIGIANIPSRVDSLEASRIQEGKDIQEIKQAQSNISGKVDTVITLLKRRQ